ncbi:MAG: hypothetical protein LBF22_14730, partial [Deltaproteobacteria bacterium]|nr:hypothetical protein [Deltaproteobacteria bacterium]
MSVEKIHDFQFNSFEYNKVEDPKYGLGKTIYFTTDNKYAISFYTPKLIDDELVKRLRFIIYVCSKWIFDSPGGDFYKDKFSWPEYLIYENNQLATVTPVYPKRFFFGSDKSNKDSPILPGSLKEPYWFASPFNLNAYVPQKEKGNLLGFLNICLNLARGINKLHEFDLLPANISFNNCLVDPVSGSALIKEISHLIIDGISDYQLVESLEFIAPELVNNRFKSSKVKIPHSKETDR